MIQINESKLTRFVAVDHRKGAIGAGRVIDVVPVDISVSVQDDGRTLKVFYKDCTKEPESPKGLLRQILEDIKVVNKVESLSDDPCYEDWDGELAFSGIKRMIYGIWNNGCNEHGESIVEQQDSAAQFLYERVIDRYKKYKEIKVYL